MVRNENPGIVGADSEVVVEVSELVEEVVLDVCTSNSTSGCQNSTLDRYLMLLSGDQSILSSISVVTVLLAVKVQENVIISFELILDA